MLGIEPAANVAEAARRKHVPTLVQFSAALARRLVSEGKRADLIMGNNVLAQVPDLNDFTAATAIPSAAEGVITLEFPHLERLMVEHQFDTIYHQHFSYFSLLTIESPRASAPPEDIRCRATRYSCGSLRVYLCHDECRHQTSFRANELEARSRERTFHAGIRRDKGRPAAIRHE